MCYLRNLQISFLDNLKIHCQLARRCYLNNNTIKLFSRKKILKKPSMPYLLTLIN